MLDEMYVYLLCVQLLLYLPSQATGDDACVGRLQILYATGGNFNVNFSFKLGGTPIFQVDPTSDSGIVMEAKVPEFAGNTMTCILNSWDPKS